MATTINFGQQFKRDLTKGRDYSQPFDAPEPTIINISKDGMTDAELAEGGQRLKNQANEWQYVNQWLQVALLSAQAHELVGKVQSAEIKASTSWQETLTSYATFQSAELSREMAEFKLEIDKQKLAVSKEDLLVQLQEIQVQHGANVLALLEGVHSLVSQRIVTALKGVDVSSVPEVQFKDVVGSLPPVDFSRTVDIDNFLKSSSNSNQSQSPQN
ncbi:MAG TPA: hypothetical protein VIQ31_12460 [Phormidium sp.]